MRRGPSRPVHGAGLGVTQLSRAPLHGSLAFAAENGVVYSSGWIGGRVALSGPLSEKQVTLGMVLASPPGTRQWLNAVVSGDVGVFLAGDDHDSVHVSGTLYAPATLALDRLEEHAALGDLVLNARKLGGSGIVQGRDAERVVDSLTTRIDVR